jgi:hypothetical protein
MLTARWRRPSLLPPVAANHMCRSIIPTCGRRQTRPALTSLPPPALLCSTLDHHSARHCRSPSSPFVAIQVAAKLCLNDLFNCRRPRARVTGQRHRAKPFSELPSSSRCTNVDHHAPLSLDAPPPWREPRGLAIPLQGPRRRRGPTIRPTTDISLPPKPHRHRPPCMMSPTLPTDKAWLPDLPKGSDNYRFGWIRDTPIRLQIQRNEPYNLSTTNPLVINLAVARLTSPRRLTLACESKNTSKCTEK